jgi:hypothetical protein
VERGPDFRNDLGPVARYVDLTSAPAGDGIRIGGVLQHGTHDRGNDRDARCVIDPVVRILEDGGPVLSHQFLPFVAEAASSLPWWHTVEGRQVATRHGWILLALHK